MPFFLVNFANIMPNTFFRFRKFIVFQDQCAMKVGTDSVLLGAWARGGHRILDIGTGTGVIALMMAQRFERSVVEAVELDASACVQAEENVARSPFAERVKVVCMPVQQMATIGEYEHCFDAVVCNPPFFENALKAPGKERNMARHTDFLPFSDLFEAVRKLMTPGGMFSVIIPFDFKDRLIEEAAIFGFMPSRICSVKTTPRKTPKRFLMEFRRVRSTDMVMEEGLLETEPGKRSEWYTALTRDFYL